VSDISVSVVICTHSHDRWNDLEEAVDSVSAQTFPAREIIVAVDHSASLLQRARNRWPALLVVENGDQHGLSGARNAVSRRRQVRGMVGENQG
jgi:glycosyltransferase involved in cell wall biosynthesis